MSALTLLFASLVSGQHCASMWEHNFGGGAEYKIILHNNQKEISNLRGYYSIAGTRKKSWWDDRITSFYVQPGCKLSLWCGYDKKTCWPFACNHNTYFMDDWTYSNTRINLINSWNDCVSKFACECNSNLPSRRIDGEKDGDEDEGKQSKPVQGASDSAGEDGLKVRGASDSAGEDGLKDEDCGPKDDSAFTPSEIEEDQEEEKERAELAHRLIGPVVAKLEKDIEKEVARQLRVVEMEERHNDNVRGNGDRTKRETGPRD